MRRGRQQYDGFIQRGAQRKGDRFQHQLARFQLGEIQHVIDDAEQVIGRAFDGIEIVTLGGTERRFQRLTGKADHAIERCAQLMRHVGKELRLDARRFLRAFAR